MSGRIPPRCRVLAILAILAIAAAPGAALAQHSVARQWNEVLLEAIRHDNARPTVHARNLFHTSVAMYDAWAVFDGTAETFFLGKTIDGFTCPFYGIDPPADVLAARNEAISYAAYRLLSHRFARSPGASGSLARFDSLFAALGYDPGFISTDYRNGSYAALGNHIADNLIRFGLQDGSNEAANYANRHYEPENPPLLPHSHGTSGIVDPNHWQQLGLPMFIGQSGVITTTDFVGAEWGHVVPFALEPEDLEVYTRDGFDYPVYHDPGPPPTLDTLNTGGVSAEYQWGFLLVAAWGAHLDPTDGVMWDISPASGGNLSTYPTALADYHDFYDLMDGGDPGTGRTVNPRTGQPYTPQLVPRGDYARVLAEFWADGPASETPPGHWFVILNYVDDHPLFERRYRGTGPPLDPLEWDVKAYLTLGGAVHDAAVTAWGIKGWYDYVRPISAIRCMSERGQCTDPGAPRFDPGGIPLVPGRVEMVGTGDPLAGPADQNVGKIKLYTWRGPDYVDDPETDEAGVGWILAEDWWPYQRPTFVTPPFAGYISGHSTFSRAAAVVMELLTGDPYFPGGMGEFFAPRNEFLVFEEGPSVDVTLQWATYRDASDQTSLSRIWGGIHPPADDMPGRHLGDGIGFDAFQFADRLFRGTADSPVEPIPLRVYPNPVRPGTVVTLEANRPATSLTVRMYDIAGRLVRSEVRPVGGGRFASWDPGREAAGAYVLRVTADGWEASRRLILLR